MVVQAPGIAGIHHGRALLVAHPTSPRSRAVSAGSIKGLAWQNPVAFNQSRYWEGRAMAVVALHPEEDKNILVARVGHRP